MNTLEELNDKLEQVLKLNNSIFEELEKRGDWNTSHWRIKPFIDDIMDSMGIIQNECILPYFEATGKDIFHWLVLKLDSIKTSDKGYFEAMDYVLENRLDDAILQYELVQAEIDDFYYQLAK